MFSDISNEVTLALGDISSEVDGYFSSTRDDLEYMALQRQLEPWDLPPSVLQFRKDWDLLKQNFPDVVASSDKPVVLTQEWSLEEAERAEG